MTNKTAESTIIFLLINYISIFIFVESLPNHETDYEYYFDDTSCQY